MIPVVFLVLSGLVAVFHPTGKALVRPHVGSGFALRHRENLEVS